MGNSCCCCVAVRSAVSKKKRRLVAKYSEEMKHEVPEGGVDLDLAKVHPRIVAMGFPATGVEALYRNPLEQVRQYLDLVYGEEYQVYNLCAEKQHQYGPERFYGRVKYYPFLDHHPCPLNMIVDFVADSHEYLAGSPKRVVVIHCKAGKGRTGLMACCLMMQLNPELFGNADQAILEYGVARTLDGKGLTHRSQIRYVQYWGLIQRNFGGRMPLEGGPVVNLKAIVLHHVMYAVNSINALVIITADSAEHALVDGVDGCVFEELPEGVVRVATRSVHTDASAAPFSSGSLDGLLLKDDFRIELRSSVEGKCIGAVSAHTLFIEQSYHYSKIDKLYKCLDLPETARMDLELVH